jgi:hypothetical protein
LIEGGGGLLTTLFILTKKRGNMAVIKAINKNKQRGEKEKKRPSEVSLEAQERLAEILSDRPRLISLNGTEWEIRALRMGTQYLIAQEVIKINKVENANFGDVVKQFAINMPSVLKVLTLALLNDKDKIFKNGSESEGYSELYEATYDTLAWECEVSEFGNILLETLQLLDTSFFMESCRIVEMFKVATTARRTTTKEQK